MYYVKIMHMLWKNEVQALIHFSDPAIVFQGFLLITPSTRVQVTNSMSEVAQVPRFPKS